jgi:hypothetical protein
MAIVSDLSGNSPIGYAKDLPIPFMEAALNSYAVTPSDSVDLPSAPTEAITCQVAGTVKVTYQDGTIDTIGLAAGIWQTMRVKRVWATGTTATGISVF